MQLFSASARFQRKCKAGKILENFQGSVLHLHTNTLFLFSPLFFFPQYYGTGDKKRGKKVKAGTNTARSCCTALITISATVASALVILLLNYKQFN